MTTVLGQPGYIGIDKTLKLIEDSKKLVTDAVELLRGGPISLFAIGRVISVVNDVKLIISDVQGVLPELRDLDESETARLGQASYEAVKDMLSSLAGLKVN